MSDATLLEDFRPLFAEFRGRPPAVLRRRGRAPRSSGPRPRRRRHELDAPGAAPGALEASARPRPPGSRPLRLDWPACGPRRLRGLHRRDSGAGDNPSRGSRRPLDGRRRRAPACRGPPSPGLRPCPRRVGRHLVDLPPGGGVPRAHRTPETRAPCGASATPIAPRSSLRALTFGYWGAGLPRDLTAEAVLGFLEGGHDATDVAAASAALVRDDPRLDLDRVACPTHRALGLAGPDGAARGWLRVRAPAQGPHPGSRRGGPPADRGAPGGVRRNSRDFLDTV